VDVAKAISSKEPVPCKPLTDPLTVRSPEIDPNRRGTGITGRPIDDDDEESPTNVEGGEEVTAAVVVVVVAVVVEVSSAGSLLLDGGCSDEDMW
jgi:hypothetical protein